MAPNVPVQIKMCKRIESMYLVFVITQDEMKTYLASEQKEILNISNPVEPLVESYVNDEL